VTDKSCHVRVTFLGTGLTFTERNHLLLEWERVARLFTGKPVEVFLDRMGDDSKLRTMMTTEQRDKL
jgi:hypothetical protein